MLDDISYIVNDTISSIAIEELQAGMPVPEWINTYQKLFSPISYGPSDMPKLADCHHQGRYFENIFKFHQLFQDNIHHRNNHTD